LSKEVCVLFFDFDAFYSDFYRAIFEIYKLRIKHRNHFLLKKNKIVVILLIFHILNKKVNGEKSCMYNKNCFFVFSIFTFDFSYQFAFQNI